MLKAFSIHIGKWESEGLHVLPLRLHIQPPVSYMYMWIAAERPPGEACPDQGEFSPGIPSYFALSPDLAVTHPRSKPPAQAAPANSTSPTRPIA